MGIIGYQYKADEYCSEECVLSHTPYETLEEWSTREGGLDQGDSEDFPQPILAETETDTPRHCCICEELIDFSWHGGTVDYVVNALREYVVGKLTIPLPPGRPEILDDWDERLGDCVIDDKDQWIRTLYSETREYEENTASSN